MNAPLPSSSTSLPAATSGRRPSPVLWAGAGLAAGVVAAAAGALVWQKVSAPVAAAPVLSPAPVASAVMAGPAAAAASGAASAAAAASVALAASAVPTSAPVVHPAHKVASHKLAAPAKTPAAPAERPASSVATAPVAAVQAPPASATRAVCTNCGVVESVQEVKEKGHGTGLGAVAGGVVGGVVGNQFGKNSRIIGAIGGALVGHQIERDVRSTVDYKVVVRMEDGSRETVTQAQSVPVGTHVTVHNGVLRVNNGTGDTGGSN